MKEGSAEPSKADSLRGFVTERLAAASREILAAVETVVTAYEEEASGLRLEILWQRRQLELLQGTVTVGTEGLPTNRSHGDGLKGQDPTASSSSFSHQSQSDGRKSGSEAQDTIDLSICILNDSKISFLSKNAVKKCPLVSLKCPQGLQWMDFLNLLRSAVPQLAADDQPFDILMLDKKRRLQPLTPEIIRNVRSTGLRKPTLYIRLKTQEEAQKEVPGLQTENSSAMLVCEEVNRLQETRTTFQQHIETEDDRLTMSGEEDSAAEMEARAVDGNEGDIRDANSSWRRDVTNEDEETKVSKLINEGVHHFNGVWVKTENSADFSCKVCKAAEKSEVALVKHAWRHSEEAGSVCGVCGASVQVLKDHLQSEHRTDEGPNCGLAVLHLNEDLKGQPVELTHPPEDNHSSFLSELPSEDSQELQESCHRCPTCQKVFELEARLKAHCRTHSTCKTYLCGVCGKFLSSNRALSRHKMTHSGERPHRCKICKRGFKLVTTLKQHEKIHADRERPYLCDVCCKMFLTSKQLLIHMRTHTDEKPYHCNRCGKGFTTRGPLTIHMRVHTGETPYRCPHCGWSFKRKTHLDDHVTIHTGAKPYVCGICGKTCARRTYLTVHMRTHNGERPYKCSLCEKAFTQSHCLKTHMKSHKGAEAAL
ncbi:PREDICTED: zinc finger protein 239-like [Cyprinodon variegatus]|uniref:Zinc finger protein 239-like n=1 Tax=Cyprinodon variegatus TaxID=28743 RepID=A0A3Q2GQ60_CYPVA|nr:PREDICTED: zinc finger protein 239-like [Cyprinodon variegatus]